MAKKYSRRSRRQSKMHIRSHGKFSVRHTLKSGRTGSAFSKQLGGRREK